MRVARFIHPPLGVLVERVKVLKRARHEAIALNVLKGSFDLSLPVGLSRWQRHGNKSVMHRKGEELGIIDRAMRLSAKDYSFLVVIKDLGGESAKPSPRQDMLSFECYQVFPAIKVNELSATETQHQTETPDSLLSILFEGNRVG
jgi:hypothetical protein